MRREKSGRSGERKSGTTCKNKDWVHGDEGRRDIASRALKESTHSSFFAPQKQDRLTTICGILSIRLVFTNMEVKMATMPPPEAVSEYEKERGKPMPSMNHGAVQANVIAALSKKYGEQYRLFGELTLDLAPAATPDICVYPELTLDWQNDQIRATAMPLITIEIQSPTQSIQELINKIQRLLAAGVQSAWLVEPAFKLVAVYTSSDEPRIYTEGELYDEASGIRIELDEIFR